MKESNAPSLGRTPAQKFFDKWQGLIYLIPWIIGFVVFKAIPFGQSLYYSFTDMNFFKSGTAFVGLQNYITAFTTTKITKALIITFKYAFITVPLKLIFALFIAYILNFKIACVNLFRTVYYIPSILGGSVAIAGDGINNLTDSASSIVTLLPTIAKGIESVNSIGEVLLSEDIEDNEGKEKLEQVTGTFDFEDVCFHYKNNEHNVLNHLNLHVKSGETIALVGESGAGKSTILNLVIGFNQAESGKVLIDGKDISKIDLRTYRKHLAVVPQTSILFSGTIRDNITYGCENVSEEELQKVIKAANLSDLIASLPKGLDTMVGEHGGKLSGGQRQRISIARALIRDPKVIVLDEATSALDSISEKLIQQALNNLTEGRTTFIVAHRLSTIRDADRIAVIADGRCAEYGTYEELMALQGEFYQLKQIQS